MHNTLTLSPTTIGVRYYLLEPLGTGSMGTVYRAFDRLTARHVALKRVMISAARHESSSPDSTPVRRDLQLVLAHEFRALASLRHPHIVTVLDYGFDAENLPYLVMELVENALTIREAGQAQPTKDKILLLVQMLQALSYLHRRGIVHRDLKPGNVLVAGGEVKVLDFGLAAAKGQSSGSAGTLSYMAPEVLTGHAADVSTDLYGVGVIAFELFTGHHPFRLDTAPDETRQDTSQLIHQIMLAPPDVLTAGLDAPIAAILNRLLAKNPADRYANAGQVIEVLSRLTDQPIPYETATTRDSFLQAAEFIGRDSELAVLEDALAQAGCGKGSTWMVGGESGVGKSRLVDELRVQALIQGVLVLRGQAVSEGGQPYHIWRDVLRWLCLQTTLTDLEVGVLKGVVPDIGALLRRDAPPLPDLEPQAMQERLGAVVDGMFQRQTRPILILMEDLQWSGSVDLALLARLTRSASGLPLLIVGNYRDDERPDLTSLLPGARLLKLNRFAQNEIARISESMLGAAGQEPHLVSLLQRETEGNVFFLIEVVRALAEDAGRLDNITGLSLPDKIFAEGVQQAIYRRLARIAAEARPLLSLAAIAGRELDLKVLHTLAPTIDLQSWLTASSDAAVLEVRGDHWLFAHDKLREALIAEQLPESRSLMHRQVAQAIEGVYPGARERAAALAYHWAQAGDTAQEKKYAALAGEQALSSAAYKESIQFLERAAAIPDDSAAPLQAATVEYQLGMAYYGLAKLDASRLHMQRALKLLGWQDATSAAGLYAALGKHLALHLVRPLRSLERYQRYPREVLLLAARICAHFTQITYFSGENVRAFLNTVRGTNFAEAAGISPELARAYSHMTLAAGHVPLHRIAQVYSRRALDAARAAGQPAASGYSLIVTGMYQTSVGNWEQSRESFVEARDIFAALGDQRRWREAIANLAVLTGLQGAFTESFKLREALNAAGERDNDVQARGWGLAGMGEMALWLHLDDAIPYLKARIDLICEFPDDVDVTTTAFALLALAYWRNGQREEARRQAAVALEHSKLLGERVFYSFQGFASVVEVYLQLWEAQPEDDALAAAVYHTFEAMRSFAQPFPVYRSWVSRNRGTMLWIMGKTAPAQKAWTESLAEAVRYRMPYDEALARFEIGRHLSAGDPDHATHLRCAAEIFAQLGAVYDLTRVETLLN